MTTIKLGPAVPFDYTNAEGKHTVNYRDVFEGELQVGTLYGIEGNPKRDGRPTSFEYVSWGCDTRWTESRLADARMRLITERKVEVA